MTRQASDNRAVPGETCGIEPLAIGTVYDGQRIEEVVGCDPTDDYQPHLYRLSNGETVWIPRKGA